ncbi:hypothetical protein CRENBAI_013051 [Crenichthys baileyi]|uniref:Immunoglobulin V-set domain-containing protein n=1 Tax=Crenichthys baileyi TaxID=28760 RepID=A0AAV9SE12_9TELE
MDYYGLSLLIASLVTGVSCEGLTAVKDKEFRSEGSSVTLSYNYSNKIAAGDSVFWYRQYPGKPPEFLISHLGSGQKLQNLVPGFSFKVRDDITQMDLQIISAAVTNSAVYYCATREPVQKHRSETSSTARRPRMADEGIAIRAKLDEGRKD